MDETEYSEDYKRGASDQTTDFVGLWNEVLALDLSDEEIISLFGALVGLLELRLAGTPALALEEALGL
jgi:hypothetical protein